MRRIHPGEILREEYMVPLGLSVVDLARRTGLSPLMVYELRMGAIDVSPDIADRLANCFGTTPEFWLNLQRACDGARLPPCSNCHATGFTDRPAVCQVCRGAGRESGR